MTGVSEATAVAFGRICFGAALIVFGLQQVVYRDFVTRVVAAWPSALPGRALWAVLIGVALVAVGLAILAGARARRQASWFGACMLLSFVVFGLPAAAQDVMLGGAWTRAGKALALAGGAFAMAGALRRVSRDEDAVAIDRLIALAPLFLGAFMVLGGVQHFYWADGVSRLVPAWIPPNRIFWTYAAGLALVAGGAGLMMRRTLRPAAAFAGLMIFSWVFLVHLPLVVATAGNANETTALFEALAFSGTAFVIAGTTRRAEE